MSMRLPKQGIGREALFEEMRKRKEQDADWHGGRTFCLIYPVNDEVDGILAEANRLYMFENALNPLRFPSLRQMEVDVVSMTAGLLNAPEGTGGCMTSGGTESILMAVLAARERARAERGVTEPEILAPRTAHPAFAKAAKYLGLTLRQIPIDADLRADVGAAEKMIGEQTALVVGSAPNYPFGTIDPIAELAGLAAERGISFHTDSCVGGFFLPFMERLGHPVPPFDFRVPGVTTMSADVHKYGYCTKGASVVVHRYESHLKKYQLFVFKDWPGGLYLSFAMAGARPAAPIAAAWSVMRYLGEDGYLGIARDLLSTTRKIRSAIDETEGLRVIGDPFMCVLAFTADGLDIGAIADVMDERGWHLDRQTDPDALHMMVSPKHGTVADRFIADLRDAVKHHGISRGVEARYS